MNTNRRMVSHVAAISLTFWLSSTMAEEDALQAELLRCAALPAETERVNCYDALAQRNLRPPETGTAGKPEEPKPVEDLPAPPEPVTEPSSAQTVEITDDIGSEQVDGGNDAEAAVYHARVTSCQKNSSGKVFFFFENGQIWKQTDYSRFRYRECEFDVALTRDTFGYKIKIVGQKASYRVSRVK
ncbi:MAG: hypothetical protein GWP64_08295 [Gammaproteobacteria bacterium]|nr:hypothetical protein [Gammaproteobacteria bacterium]